MDGDREAYPRDAYDRTDEREWTRAELRDSHVYWADTGEVFVAGGDCVHLILAQSPLRWTILRYPQAARSQLSH